MVSLHLVQQDQQAVQVQLDQQDLQEAQDQQEVQEVQEAQDQQEVQAQQEVQEHQVETVEHFNIHKRPSRRWAVNHNLNMADCIFCH